MRAFNFFKYDLRRSMYFFLLSVLLFAPIGGLMGCSMESLLGVFSYMAFVVMVMPTSLFTYEQKSDCGFDGLLPATDMDKVLGRYMLGAVCIVFQLIVGIITCIVLEAYTGMKLSGLGVISMVFIAADLIYLSIAFVFYYVIGRNLNPQIRGTILMLPSIIIWVVVNGMIGVMGVTNDLGFLTNLMENKELISALALLVGVAMYIISAVISAQIVKQKDYR